MPSIHHATRRRLVGFFTALAAAATIAVGVAPPAAASDGTVRPGESIAIPNSAGAIDVLVEPAGAGTASIGPDGVLFTAASDADPGLVTITFLIPASGPSTRVIAIIDASASARGQFVPTAAPGPCVLITANTFVDFGEVILGGDYKETPAPPNIAGCAPAGVAQDVLISGTDARNGPVVLDVDSCTNVATCAPGSGQYSVAVPSTNTTPGGEVVRDQVVTSTAAPLLDNQPGDFTTTAVGLGVKMPAALPSGEGTLFVFDVTFTAVAA